jgi:hypothetical protein
MFDSDWEAEFCRVAESHPKVRAYVKNHNLGLEVPYRYGSGIRKYRPDFIVLVDAQIAGARYRVRTCDPFRVREVLYH